MPENKTIKVRIGQVWKRRRGFVQVTHIVDGVAYLSPSDGTHGKGCLQGHINRRASKALVSKMESGNGWALMLREPLPNSTTIQGTVTSSTNE